MAAQALGAGDEAAAGTSIGAMSAPTTSSVPFGRSPPNTAAMAPEFVTVEMIRSTPPSAWSASAGSPAVLST